MKWLKLRIVMLIVGFSTISYAQEMRLMLPLGTNNSQGKHFISADAKLMATTGFKEPVISVWDVRSGQLIASLLDSTAFSGFKDIYFVKNNRLISDDEASVKIWDLATAKCIFSTPENEDDNSYFVRNFFAEKANALISIYSDKILFVDVNAAKITKELKFESKITDGRLTADGKYLVAVTKTGFKFFNTATWNPVPFPENKIGSAKLAADGSSVLILNKSGLEVYDLNASKNVLEYKIEDAKSVSFGKRNNKIILTTPTAIHIYTPGERTWKVLKALPQFELLEINPDGNMFIIAQKGLRGEEVIKVIDSNGTDVLKLSPNQEHFFIENGKFVLQINSLLNEAGQPLPNATATIWDISLKKKKTSWKVAKGDLNYFPSANKIMNTDGYEIKMLNPLTGNAYGEISSKGHIQSTSSLVLSSKEKYLAESGSIWETATLQLKMIAGLPFDKFSANENYALFSAVSEEENDAEVEFWKLDGAKLLFKARKKGKSVTLPGSAISSKEDRVFLIFNVNGINELNVYDIKRYKVPPIKIILPANEIEAFQLSPDGATLAISYGNTALKGLNNSFTEIRSSSTFLVLKKLMGSAVAFSQSGKRILTVTENQKVYIWDQEQYKLLKSVTIPKVNKAVFSPDEQNVLTDQFKVIALINVPTITPLEITQQDKELLLPDRKLYGTWISDFGYSPDGGTIYYISYSEGSGAWSNTIFRWNAQTKKTIVSTDTMSTNSFISTNKNMQLNVTENNASSLNLKTGKEIELKSPVYDVSDAIFTKDDRYTYLSMQNAICKFDVVSGKLLSSSYSIDNEDYITTIPSGYYMSTPKAAKLLHYVSKDLKTITFDQLDLKFNRPDKVLEHIGSTDTLLINAYKKAYGKRVKKLDIDTMLFKSGYSVPDADFKNREQLMADQYQQQISLHISATDSSATLDRFNVWINENPVFGLKGISLKTKNTHVLDTVINVTLSDGKNIVETSATNANEIESYHTPLTVNYIPAKKTQEKLYFIGIGIDKFNQQQYNLNWSVKDIRDQVAAFKLKYGANISIDTLFNEQVNVAAIRALKTKLLSTNINDKVIITYSGHGLLSKGFDYYLSTYKVDFKDPAKEGLLYDDLEKLLDNIPARQKLMLIDACHSGELDKEELMKLQAAAPAMQANDVKAGGRGIELIEDPGHQLGLKNSFELMQSLFVNVSRNTGATIISAAGGLQFALEKNDLKNGVFSYTLLEYLKTHPHARLSEIRSYVNKRVRELTAGMQIPTSRSETVAHDWYAW